MRFQFLSQLFFNMPPKVITKNINQTQKLGEKFARQIYLSQINKNKKLAAVLGLQGDLGSGKTAFLQGFAKGLGIKEKVLSPTFVLIKKFKIKNPIAVKKFFKNFYHIDLYRIDSIKNIKELKLKDIFLNPENIVAIEWPQIIKSKLPKSAIIIKFAFVDKNKREIII